MAHVLVQGLELLVPKGALVNPEIQSCLSAFDDAMGTWIAILWGKKEPNERIDHRSDQLMLLNLTF